jgi:hypothetical protein
MPISINAGSPTSMNSSQSRSSIAGDYIAVLEALVNSVVPFGPSKGVARP